MEGVEWKPVGQQPNVARLESRFFSIDGVFSRKRKAVRNFVTKFRGRNIYK
jgi:hypothetical protein